MTTKNTKPTASDRDTPLWQAVDQEVRRRVGAFLDLRTDRRGRRVVAAVCLQNRYPHRYTLKAGAACWDYWPSLEAAAAALGIRH